MLQKKFLLKKDDVDLFQISKDFDDQCNAVIIEINLDKKKLMKMACYSIKTKLVQL